MSTESETTEINDNGEQGNQEDPNIRNLREKAKRTEAAESKLKRYEKRDELRNAGIDLTDKQLTALLATHDGADTVDDFRKTAEELNFVKPPEETPTEEQNAHKQVQNAALGAVNKGELAGKELYAQANSKEEVLAMVRASGGQVADDIE